MGEFLKIYIAAYGTRGDVFPAIALARKMSENHQVQLNLPAEWNDVSESPNLEITYFPMEFAELVGNLESIRSFRSAARAAAFIKNSITLQFSYHDAMVQKADLVIGVSLEFALPSLCEKYGVAYRFLAFTPSIFPSIQYPHPIFPWRRGPSWLNALSWQIGNILDATYVLSSINKQRKGLGLKKVYKTWPHLIGDNAILACSKHLGKLPPKFTKKATQTDYCFLYPEIPISQELAEFMEGEPYVIVHFGSMPPEDQSYLCQQAWEALKYKNVKILFQINPLIVNIPKSEKVLITGKPLPHYLILKNCLAFIHHGGAGTTHTTVRHGCPQLIIPHLLDQFYWAERVNHLRIGIAGPSRFFFSTLKFRAAVDKFFAQIEILKQNSENLARQMKKNDGLDQTVDAMLGK